MDLYLHLVQDLTEPFRGDTALLSLMASLFENVSREQTNVQHHDLHYPVPITKIAYYKRPKDHSNQSDLLLVHYTSLQQQAWSSLSDWYRSVN